MCIRDRVAWGGWLLVTGLVFSYMEGIFHSYYTVALAPAVAAVVAGGSVLAWRQRDRVWVRIALVVVLAITAVTAWILLGRSADFVPWLRWTIAVAAVIGGVLLLAGQVWSARRITVAAIVAALFVGLAGQVAYAAETIGRPRAGAIVSAGPDVDSGFGGGRGGMPPMDGRPGQEGRGEEMFGGAGGGLLNGSTPSAQLIALLESDAGSFRWVAATIGANSAAGYQLATEDPVMPIGGFNGTDPSPTLQQFQQYVANKEIHYFIAGGMGRMGGSAGASAQIVAWVEANFHATDVDGVQVYDLS